MTRPSAPYYRDVQENKKLYRNARYFAGGVMAILALLILVDFIMTAGGTR